MSEAQPVLNSAKTKPMPLDPEVVEAFKVYLDSEDLNQLSIFVDSRTSVIGGFLDRRTRKFEKQYNDFGVGGLISIRSKFSGNIDLPRSKNCKISGKEKMTIMCVSNPKDKTKKSGVLVFGERRRIYLVQFIDGGF
ncbi:hypothetical protein [Novosphingobium taihuense]|uniref:Uncharacterized protein n=1 Tax=Novosphingobium taihuense TaxID=260085 RepID=A0A7W7EV49_9SPHN|nr:hypothetical protein [Novosphingobium taihuense]MBB4615078.1 hypothetical protein [Novosphingobium taihuense]